MARVLLLLLVACGGPGYHPIHGGDCPTDRGCEAPVEPAMRYVPPNDVAAATEKPRASCASVAHELGSLEVGNYADEDDVRAAAGKWEQACAKQHVTLAEMTCLEDAHDQATIAYCVPRWFPDQRIAILQATECRGVASSIARRFTWQLHSGTLPVQAKVAVAVLQASCEHDRWTEELASCASEKAYLADLDSAIPRPLDACQAIAPAPVMRKIEDRIAVAMRKP